MQRWLLSLIGLLTLSLSWPAPSALASSGTEWKPEELNWYGISQRRINDTRSDSSLPYLASDKYLSALARERARDMAERSYLAGTTPEGIDAGSYMSKDGFRLAHWAELRADDSSKEAAVDVAWRIINGFLNEPASRQTIIGDFDRLGVGLATRQERTVFVILVGKSLPPTPTASPTPPPADSIPGIITAAARRHGVNPDFMLRLARCESGLNPRAFNPAGPYIGLFQFSVGTFAAFGGSDIYSAADQSEITARMLARGLAFHWPVCSRVAAR